MWHESHETLCEPKCTALLNVAWQFWQPVVVGTVVPDTVAVYQCAEIVPVTAAPLFQYHGTLAP
jgi:hypothetical protein